MARVGIVDTTFRDAQQCLWATRMTTAMMLPVADAMDRAGFDVLEVAGAVQFDAAVRYLGENPWERLRLLKSRMTRTPLQALIRSGCVMGFNLVPDDLSALWAERLVANGIDRIIVFDGLHDLDNIAAPARRAREMGAKVIGWLTYSTSPVHTDALYVAKAREYLERIGVDELMIEDTSGILMPERAATLVPALKAAIGNVRLGLHSHGLIGLCQRTYIEAVAHGVDNVYCGVPPLADAAAPPSVVTTIANLRASGHTVDVDDARIAEISRHIDRVAEMAGKPRGGPRDFDAAFLGHQVPGGVISNLKAQLEAAGMAHRLDAVLAESARVRADLGWPIQVTPFAQLIAVQATLNVVEGERYRTVPLEIKKFALGYYGKLLAPIEPNVLDRIMTRGPKGVASTPPERKPVVAELRAKYPHQSDDDRLLRYFFDAPLVDKALANQVDPDEFAIAGRPLARLLKELTKRPKGLWVRVEKGDDTLEVRT